MWVEVEGPWELNRRKEAKVSVWEGAKMSLGFDRQRRSSFSDDEQASATMASKCDDSDDNEQMRRQQAKVTAVSKSDDEQAKVTSTANDLAARVNDSSRMGIVANGFGKRDRCEWVWCWDVANGFDIRIIANGEPNLMGCEGESEGKREKTQKKREVKQKKKKKGLKVILV